MDHIHVHCRISGVGRKTLLGNMAGWDLGNVLGRLHQARLPKKLTTFSPNFKTLSKRTRTITGFKKIHLN
ncbi:Uncharacterized protein TCM_037002 [Theobroma cacao]|uniref:Uncharacterized protein n=1 Tax=Theobroma cacao TaxID=3641 RepID=A0A061GQR4_THECC|nr:Uncharacterized protein TCM_037002 [Theobroma cacao]